MRKLNEECGVFGVCFTQKEAVAQLCYYGLFALQHRGQEAAGICVASGGRLQTHKDDGLVGDVFCEQVLGGFELGEIGIGHVRYSTTGSKCKENAQPIVVSHKAGNLALAHNGNLTNTAELKAMLESTGAIFHTTSDTEIISYLITKERLSSPNLETAILRVMGQIEGAFSLVITNGQRLIALKDPHGYRPLCYGKFASGGYVVASESAALDAVGATFVKELDAGEMVIFENGQVRSVREFCGVKKGKICAFEFIYFARPDSVIGGVSVHNARVRAGEILATRHPVDADLVIGVPDSGLEGAMGYAKQSGLPLEFGFLKNRYIGRSFIGPTQKSRENMVSIKLNAVRSVVEGKRLVVIDDSVVRGTTSKRTVEILRRAGAKEIHMRITAPQFVSPCFWGIDIDDRANLISAKFGLDEIARFVGVDSLGFLELEDLNEICGGEEHCNACFVREEN